MRASASAITQKGQVTVPKQIRNRLKLRPGDLVFFDDDGREVRIRKMPSHSLSAFCRDHPLGGPGLKRLLRELREEWA